MTRVFEDDNVCSRVRKSLRTLVTDCARDGNIRKPRVDRLGLFDVSGSLNRFIPKMKELVDSPLVKISSEKSKAATDVARISKEYTGDRRIQVLGYIPDLKEYAERFVHVTDTLIKQAAFFPTNVGSSL